MSSESDASSHILRAARLLLDRAPTADAADAAVEKWGRYVVKLLDGLKARQPEFLSMPDIIPLIDLLQDLADARLRVAWLAWGGDWLPGTVIEQCLSQLPAAAVKDSTLPPPSPPTQKAVPLPVSVAAPNLEPEEGLDELPISDTARPVSVATPDLGSEEELDELLMSDAAITTDGDHDAPAVSKGFPWHVDYRAKRTVPDKVLSSSKRPAKRARYTTSVSPVKSNKYRLPKAQLDLNSLFAPRKALHPCELCAEKKLCLTVTKRGVVQNRCAPCIVSHKKCEWKTYKQVTLNWAYRKEPSSFYDPVDTVEPSEGPATVSTSAPAPAITSANTRFVVQVPSPPVTAIRPRCGPKSAIERLGRPSGSHTRASPSPSPSGMPPSTSALSSPSGKADLAQQEKHEFAICECGDYQARDWCVRCKILKVPLGSLVENRGMHELLLGRKTLLNKDEDRYESMAR